MTQGTTGKWRGAMGKAPADHPSLMGHPRYGHTVTTLGIGLATGLATCSTSLNLWAQALIIWLVMEAVFYLQQRWRCAFKRPADPIGPDQLGYDG